MTRITLAKIDRKFESVPVKDKEGKVVGRVTLRKEKVGNAAERKIGRCEYCGGEISMAVGQIQRFHRECREDARDARRLGRHKRNAKRNEIKTS